MPVRPLGRRPGRPIWRPLRKPAPGRGMRDMGAGRPAVPPLLAATHELLQSENYAEAAVMYLELADKGNQRGLPQAGNLYFHAARGYALAGELSLATDTIRKAMDYLSQKERWGELWRGGTLSVHFLQDKGFPDEAQLVEKWLVELIPPAALQQFRTHQTNSRSSSKAVELPEKCPSCGGIVNPKEVEWLDANSVLCEFCGSVVRGE